MLKETLRKLMNLSLEEKPEGKITEVKIGNTTRAPEKTYGMRDWKKCPKPRLSGRWRR